jgi:D-glycero-alpha-D-manno-heptose-7-phosphate kinase
MITIKSPTRVDLAGGTLDLWPLYNFVGTARTVNMAIDIWTKVTLEPRKDQVIEINSLDLKQKWTFENYEQFVAILDPKLQLYQSVITKFHTKKPKAFDHGFSLSTQSESPIGGGLGGSSSLIISMMKAFSELTKLKFSSNHEMVHWAHNMEAEILNTPTGTQDYYPAITGGLSHLNYDTFGIEQNVIDPKGSPLYDNFLLVYTGRSHHSGLNNFEVLKSAIAQDHKVMSALNKIKMIADEMWTAIENKNWQVLPDLFKQEYDARIQLTPAFTSPEIERLHQIGLSNGALAVKICGAGGGGCVLVWVSPEHRQKVISACENEKFQCLPARPVSPL